MHSKFACQSLLRHQELALSRAPRSRRLGRKGQFLVRLGLLCGYWDSRLGQFFSFKNSDQSKDHADRSGLFSEDGRETTIPEWYQKASVTSFDSNRLAVTVYWISVVAVHQGRVPSQRLAGIGLVFPYVKFSS